MSAVFKGTIGGTAAGAAIGAAGGGLFSRRPGSARSKEMQDYRRRQRKRNMAMGAIYGGLAGGSAGFSGGAILDDLSEAGFRGFRFRGRSGIGRSNRKPDDVFRAMGGSGKAPKTKKEWEKLYKRQARKYHPDLQGRKSPREQAEAANKMKELNSLMDDVRRASHYWDKLGSISLSAFFREIQEIY